MYGYIYVTVNAVNGTQYIGQHKWNRCKDRIPKHMSKTLQEQFKLSKGFDYFPIDPNYIGSGTALAHAISKYGKHNFYVMDILDIAETKEELDKKEIEWIACYRRQGIPLYNISDGGTGGAPSGVNHPGYGKKRTAEQKENIRKSHLGELNHNFGKPLSESTRKKLSAKLSGKGNPMYGRRGVDNPNYGKSCPSKGRVQSDSERLMRSIAHMSKCPNVKPPDCTGMIVINNGQVNKKIFPHQVDQYPGWSRGMIRRNKK